MAIQTIKTGAAVNDGTGDDARTCFTKINQNFTDNANAASRLVGTNGGNVMEVGAFGVGGYVVALNNIDLNMLQPSSGYKTGYYSVNATANAPSNNQTYYIVELIVFSADYCVQVATSFYTGHPKRYMRRGLKGNWTDWSLLYSSKTDDVYYETTASAPNVFVDNTGKLCRSTSSERYKNIIADLTLDDTAYANAMQLRPIVYHSTAATDNPSWHYYSFSAESLGAYDPAFTLWRFTDRIIDDDGNVQEVPLTTPLAEGINLNAIVAFLHATNVKQGQLISELMGRIEALENAE